MHELDKRRYMLELLRRDPSEILRIASHALATFKFRYLKRCVGPGTVVGPKVEMVNAANIRVGRDCLFQEHIYMRAGNQGRITIGDRAALNSFVRIFGHGGISIGDDVQLGPGTLITTTQHDFHGDLEASFEPVVICERAWIGANVTVLPGVTIGAYAVVGAGSVVTKDIPPRSIAVGVPARVIGSLDDARGDAPRAAAAAGKGF